ALLRGGRGGVDDRTAAAGDQVRPGRAAEVEDDVHLFPLGAREGLEVHLGHEGEIGHGGVVVDDVEAAVGLQGEGDQPRRAGLGRPARWESPPGGAAMQDLKGQAAFVTGAASGIGLATAQALARRGARLILADISAPGVGAAAAGLRAAGAEAMGLTLNVAEESEWARAGEAAAAFGEVSVLVSNAGVGGGSGAFETYDPE